MQEEQKKISNFNNELDIQIALAVLRKNWFVFPILLVISLTSAFLYLRYTKPLFESSTVIQRTAQDEGKRILDIEGFEQENNLSEDVELLKSSFLLEKALRNLNLNISYFSEGEILTEEKYILSSYHVTLFELKDSSLVGERIGVVKNGDNVRLHFMKGNESHKVDLVPGEVVDNEFFQLVFKIDNPELFTRSVGENNLYFTFNDYADLTAGMMRHLVVYQLNPEAKTIFISFESNNPVLAKDVVSSVINTFFEYDLEKKSESSANILKFIDSQLDTVTVQLKESETAIQFFKDSSKVNDPVLLTQRIVDRSNILQNELLQIEMNLDLITEVDESVEKNDRLEIYNVIPAVTGTDYEDLLVAELRELHELLVEKEDIAYAMTQKNEKLKRLNREVESKTKNVRRVISSIRDQLKLKRNSIQDRIYRLESELYGIPAKEMELSRLNRMFNLNEKYYTLLIEKKTQYSISKAGYTMDNMVLQPPSVAKLISPNRKLILAGVIILTVLISLIYYLFKYLTFNEIQNPDELKRLLPGGVGFLGIVPKAEHDSKYSSLIVHEKPKSALAESCRHIRANLQFVINDDKPNVLAVSSSISGEGKTFVALNLAGILTLSGKKVLVIDLDLRKPKVHHGFGVENTKGMSNILSRAHDEDWKTCVNNSNLPGLDFITAGPIPPNPSELIVGGRLEEVISDFKQVYDYILIDNPPVGIVSDGISVLNAADCPIYVFRANYSKRLFAKRVAELVESNRISNLFVVLNGMELKKKSYGYAYGYGYGEYYTEDAPVKKKRFWKK